MAAFTYLDKSVARCAGFTCPMNRDNCRRFTERSLGTWSTKWFSNPAFEDPGTCRHMIPVKPELESDRQGVKNVDPAGTCDER